MINMKRIIITLLLSLFSTNGFAFAYMDETYKGVFSYDNNMYILVHIFRRGRVLDQEKLKKLYESSSSPITKMDSYSVGFESKIINLQEFEKEFSEIQKGYILLYPNYSETRWVGKTGHHDVLGLLAEERNYQSLVIFKGFCEAEYTAMIALGDLPQNWLTDSSAVVINQQQTGESKYVEVRGKQRKKFIATDLPFPQIIETDKTAYPKKFGKAITLSWPSTGKHYGDRKSTYTFDGGIWRMFRFTGGKSFHYSDSSEIIYCSC